MSNISLPSLIKLYYYSFFLNNIIEKKYKLLQINYISIIRTFESCFNVFSSYEFPSNNTLP